MRFDNLMGERYEGAVLFNKRKASGFKSGVSWKVKYAARPRLNSILIVETVRFYVCVCVCVCMCCEYSRPGSRISASRTQAISSAVRVSAAGFFLTLCLVVGNEASANDLRTPVVPFPND